MSGQAIHPGVPPDTRTAGCPLGAPPGAGVLNCWPLPWAPISAPAAQEAILYCPRHQLGWRGLPEGARWRRRSPAGGVSSQLCCSGLGGPYSASLPSPSAPGRKKPCPASIRSHYASSCHMSASPATGFHAGCLLLQLTRPSTCSRTCCSTCSHRCCKQASHSPLGAAEPQPACAPTCTIYLPGWSYSARKSPHLLLPCPDQKIV